MGLGGARVTLSVVRPLLYKLTNKHLIDKPTDNPLKKALKKAVLDDLQIRYVDPCVEDMIDRACFLDPRFKLLPFLSEPRKRKIISDIKEEVEAVGISTTPPTTTRTEGPPLKKKKGTLMALFEDVIEPNTSVEDDPQLTASKEVEKYLCIDTCSDQKPLLWWKKK